ncbi:hypothetical protein PAECIP111893_02370 [Paenibacillus plantiphilus]|uniref:Uncharacterized protein n=1 Tax=Paenibacillus plantiphilus TaxID=2905650 RepID=A0ABM9C6S7_9BACL|nr:hypothetical protein PAECIP111893_02370 [Paenibacillus plantiphilus]
MECGYFERRFKGYSDEKKRVVAIALGNKYYCPFCGTIHHLEVIDHGQTQEHK